MRIQSWLRRWTSLTAGRVRSRTQRWQPAEVLEPRIVPTIKVTDSLVFVVTLTSSDAVSIGVDENGKVTVDGISKNTLASKVKSLKVNCTGSFDNVVDLSGVDASFSYLASKNLGVSVTLSGGHDFVLGSDLNDTLDGGDGDDTLSGGLGKDNINGMAGVDLLTGDDGNDLLYGGNGDDDLDGGAGNDRLRGQNGNDIITGGDDNDTLEGFGGDDTLIGGDGNDSIMASTGNDVIDGDNGNGSASNYDDTIYG
ncbi:MAG: hypothetical protein IAG10_32385, partial [Planctomycetaceae bacterium]|nr:hypothetical protein [Planctomycetaceae bacterium]